MGVSKEDEERTTRRTKDGGVDMHFLSSVRHLEISIRYYFHLPQTRRSIERHDATERWIRLIPASF